MNVTYLLTSSTSDSSYYDGERYTGQFSYYGGSFCQAWVYPKGFLDRLNQSVDDLHHHHEDGHVDSLQYHERLDEFPNGVYDQPYLISHCCGLSCQFDQWLHSKLDRPNELRQKAYEFEQSHLLLQAIEPRHQQNEPFEHL